MCVWCNTFVPSKTTGEGDNFRDTTVPKTRLKGPWGGGGLGDSHTDKASAKTALPRSLTVTERQDGRKKQQQHEKSTEGRFVEIVFILVKYP